MSDDETYSILRDPKFWAAILGDQENLDIVDFHASLEGAPLVWLLGSIVLEFSYAEHQLKVLLWNYLGHGFDFGHIFTREMGSDSIARILVESASRAGESEETTRLIETSIKAFSICRENRNALAHSMTLEADSDKTYWVRSSRKQGFDQSQVIATVDEVFLVNVDIKRTAQLLFELSLRKYVLNKGEEYDRDLPLDFPLPARLNSTHVSVREEAEKLGLTIGD